MTRYTLSLPAERDLYDIDTFISRDDPEAAERVIGDLEAAMKRLTGMPRIGHGRPEFGWHSRFCFFFPVSPYLIVYYPDTKPLEIVRVLHQSRDIQRELQA